MSAGRGRSGGVPSGLRTTSMRRASLSTSITCVKVGDTFHCDSVKVEKRDKHCVDGLLLENMRIIPEGLGSNLRIILLPPKLHVAFKLS